MELFKVSSRIIKILLSVSLSSLLLSSLPLLFQSLNQFSINKSYVFLFCNGLMVFIAKNSTLPPDSSSQFNDLDAAAAPVNSQEHDMMVAADSADQQEEEEEEKRMIVAVDSQEEDEVADTETEEEEEEEEKRMIVADPQEEDEVADTEKEEEEEGNNGVWITEEEEEEEVEELNKKCEDFIRKMKAAFCSEPFSHNDGCFNHHQRAMVTVR